MGAEPWSLPELLFLMIPRFLPIRGARECATPTTPVHAGIRTRVFMLSNCGDDRPPAHASISRAGSRRYGSTYPSPNPETSHHAPGCDRSRAGSGPISTRSTTDLGTGYDRSHGGERPISTRNSTDLDGGGCPYVVCQAVVVSGWAGWGL